MSGEKNGQKKVDVETPAAAEQQGVNKELAQKINEAHRACEKAGAAALEYALRCGEMLIKAKQQTKHGNWLTWLGENFAGSEDTAQNYMRLARHREDIVEPNTEHVRYSGVREALSALAAPPALENASERSSSKKLGADDAEAKNESTPKTMVFDVGSLPDPATLANNLHEGNGVALTFEAGEEGEAELEKAKNIMMAMYKAARAAGLPAHFLLACSPKQNHRDRGVTALRPIRPKKSRDPIPVVLQAAPATPRKEDPGITVSRDEDRLDRLVLRTKNIRLSVAVAPEQVEKLTKPIVVPVFEKVYRRLNRAGNVVTFASSVDDEGRDVLHMTAGNWHGELIGSKDDGANYDRAPQPGGKEEWTYEARTLRVALDRLLPHVWKHKSKPILATILMRPDERGTELTATDTYRIARATIPGATPKESLPLPARDCAALAQIISTAEPRALVRFARAGEHVVVSGVLEDGAEYEIAMHPVEGEYPDLEEAIPDENDLAWFELPRHETIHAVHRALIIKKQADQISYHFPRPLYLRVDEADETNGGTQTIALTFAAEGPYFFERLPVRGPREAKVREAALNLEHLSDILKASDEEMVRIGFNQSDPYDGAFSRKPMKIGDDIILSPMSPPQKNVS